MNSTITLVGASVVAGMAFIWLTNDIIPAWAQYLGCPVLGMVLGYFWPSNIFD